MCLRRLLEIRCLSRGVIEIILVGLVWIYSVLQMGL